MVDYSDEASNGVWTLRLDNDGSQLGIIDAWCVGFYQQNVPSEQCSSPAATITDSPQLTDTSDFADDLNIADVTVQVDITHPLIGDLFLGVTSPDGVLVCLYEGPILGTGGSESGMSCTFSDTGVVPGTVPYDCGCDIRSEGPGNLADFYASQSLGEWTFRARDAVSGNVGTLDTWCLTVLGCSLEAPSDLTCVDGATFAGKTRRTMRR